MMAFLGGMIPFPSTKASSLRPIHNVMSTFHARHDAPEIATPTVRREGDGGSTPPRAGDRVQPC